MNTKEEERYRILKEYLNELIEKFDQLTEDMKIKMKEIDDLNKHSDELMIEIEMVRKLYDKLPKRTMIDNIDTIEGLLGISLSFYSEIKKPIKVIEALKLIFKYSPSKEFEPVELKDELEKLREKNLLDSQAENLLWITHSTLKTLIKNNYIVRRSTGGKPTYKLKQFGELPKMIQRIIELGTQNNKDTNE